MLGSEAHRPGVGGCGGGIWQLGGGAQGLRSHRWPTTPGRREEREVACDRRRHEEDKRGGGDSGSGDVALISNTKK